MKRKDWTPDEDRQLADLYPDASNHVLAAVLGRNLSSVKNRANHLGLRKSKAYMATNPGCIKPGTEPWNKGMKGLDIGGKETRFKAGEMHGAAQHNYRPIGSLRLSKDGHLEQKVNDTNPVPARRWVGVHRLVWEAVNGAIPDGHIVVFRSGFASQKLEEITIDRLELITRAENMRRNSYHTNYPPEVAKLVQLKGAIARQANRITKANHDATTHQPTA